jgi:hypothetical protein
MARTLLQEKQLIYDCKKIAENLILKQGKSVYEAVSEMMRIGADEKMATDIAYEIEANQIEANQGTGKKKMIWGAVIFIIGLGITLADVGTVFWFAIIFGIYQFYKGYEKYNQNY